MGVKNKNRSIFNKLLKGLGYTGFVGVIASGVYVAKSNTDVPTPEKNVEHDVSFSSMVVEIPLGSGNVQSLEVIDDESAALCGVALADAFLNNTERFNVTDVIDNADNFDEELAEKIRYSFSDALEQIIGQTIGLGCE